MAYKTSHAEREESEVSKWAKDLGIKVEQFSKEQVLKTQPDIAMDIAGAFWYKSDACLLYTSPSPRDRTRSRMPSSA